MLKVTLKTLIMLIVPVVVVMTAQAAASEPYHAKALDRFAARRQLWNSVSSPNGISLSGTMLGDPMDMGPGTMVNDPNVYRDGQPISDFDINPHGG
jgi:hypothetical protein